MLQVPAADGHGVESEFGRLQTLLQLLGVAGCGVLDTGGFGLPSGLLLMETLQS